MYGYFEEEEEISAPKRECYTRGSSWTSEGWESASVGWDFILKNRSFLILIRNPFNPERPFYRTLPNPVHVPLDYACSFNQSSVVF